MSAEWYGAEKRRFPRAKFPCKIVVYLPQQHTVVTHTENIGCGGVRIIIDENLEVSSVVGIEIFLDNGKVLRCKGKVVWKLEEKSPLAKDAILFDLGLEFIDMKKEDKETIKHIVASLLEK